MFCSICGDNIKAHESLICRSCGLLYCQYCAKHDHEESNSDTQGESRGPDLPSSTYRCRCGNGDIQLLEDLRGYLIQDFLRYKNKIQEIANYPVQIFQTFLEIREKLINLGSTFLLIPDSFSFQKDILSSFSLAEQFALEHLYDLRSNIRNLYDQLLVKKEQFIEPDELIQINLRLSMLAGKIEKFQLGFDSYFNPLLEDAEDFNQKILDYHDMFTIFSKYSNLRSLLDKDERIYFISGPMWSNLGGIINRNIQVMITADKLIFFKQPMIKFKKKVKVVKVLTSFEITGFEIKQRKFRSALLKIRKDRGEIELSGDESDHRKIERCLQLLSEHIQVPSPKAWKHWQIGKIWSSDSYYANIDRLIRWELRPNRNSPKSYLPPIDLSKAGQDIDYQTDIVDYLSKQMERISQRIRVCDYMINDLKSRKNTMSVNEFYSLYESLAMKLTSLEEERNSLLGHYSKGNTDQSAIGY